MPKQLASIGQCTGPFIGIVRMFGRSWLLRSMRDNRQNLGKIRDQLDFPGSHGANEVSQITSH